MNIATRERLLRAASRLFTDSGYRGASVRDICNLCGPISWVQFADGRVRTISEDHEAEWAYLLGVLE